MVNLAQSFHPSVLSLVHVSDVMIPQKTQTRCWDVSGHFQNCFCLTLLPVSFLQPGTSPSIQVLKVGTPECVFKSPPAQIQVPGMSLGEDCPAFSVLITLHHCLGLDPTLVAGRQEQLLLLHLLSFQTHFPVLLEMRIWSCLSPLLKNIHPSIFGISNDVLSPSSSSNLCCLFFHHYISLADPSILLFLIEGSL